MTETFRAILAAIFPSSPTLWLRLILQWLIARLAVIIETRFDELDHNPKSRASLAAGIAFAEDGVALLIGQRTRELMALRFRIQRRWRLPRPSTPPSFEQLLARWVSLLESLEHIERIARRRAARLIAERDKNPLRLDAAHRSTSPTLRVVEDSMHCREVLHRLWRGRWIARPRAQDGGGRASARGPPILHDFPQPNPTA